MSLLFSVGPYMDLGEPTYCSHHPDGQGESQPSRGATLLLHILLGGVGHHMCGSYESALTTGLCVICFTFPSSHTFPCLKETPKSLPSLWIQTQTFII